MYMIHTQKTWSCSPLLKQNHLEIFFGKSIRLVFRLRILPTIMSLVIITLLIVLQNTRSQNCVAYDTPEKCFQMSAAFANQGDDINAVCEEGGRVLKRVLDDTLVEESERLERCCESSPHSQEEKSCNEYEDVDSFCT